MAIVTTKDGKQYQERCPVCTGIHIYDQKPKGPFTDTQRYVCPDCGHRTVAPVLEALREPLPSLPLQAGE